jgi:hypothetical protein
MPPIEPFSAFKRRLLRVGYYQKEKEKKKRKIIDHSGMGRSASNNIELPACERPCTYTISDCFHTYEVY